MPLNEREIALNNVINANFQMYISMLYVIMIGFGVKWFSSPNDDTIPIFILATVLAIAFHLTKIFINMPLLRIAFYLATIAMYGTVLFLLFYKGIFSLLSNGFGANMGTAISLLISLFSLFSLKLMGTMSSSIKQFDS